MKGLLIGVAALGLFGCGARSSLGTQGGDVADGRVPTAPADCPPHPPGALLWSTVVPSSFCSTGQIALGSDPLGDAFIELAQSGQTFDDIYLGPFTVELAKVDIRGDMRWRMGVGGAPFNGGGALAADNHGNARVLTPNPLGSDGQPVLSKVSNAGSLDIAPSLTKNSDGSWLPMAVGTDTNQNTLLLGMAYSAVDFGGGLLTTRDGEFFVAKLNDANAHQWSRAFGGPVSSVDLSAETGGSMTLAGVLTGDVTFGDMTFSAKGDAVFVATLDPDGRAIFSHLLQSTTTPEVFGVARDTAQNSYVAIGYGDDLDLGDLVLSGTARGKLIVKYDVSGALIWAKPLGQGPSLSLTLSENDDLLVSGVVGPDFDLDDDVTPVQGSMFVAKLDPGGNPRWITYLPPNPDFVPTVARGGCDGALVAGRFQTAFDTGAQVLRSRFAGPYWCWAPALMSFGG